MKRVISLVLASALLLATSATAFANPRGENHCNRATPGGIQCGGHGNHP